MSLLKIRQLGPDDEQAFLEGLQAWQDEDPSWHTFIWTEGMSHKEHLQQLTDESLGQNLPEEKVPHTMLYGFLDGVIVGRCSVRHELNDFLRNFGGHLGYGVAPPFRRRGFASQRRRRRSLPRRNPRSLRSKTYQAILGPALARNSPTSILRIHFSRFAQIL